jgi:DNA-binding response OmpR family regulator
MGAPAATVLVVDDSHASREGLATLLRDDGYRALTARDASSAMAMLAAEAVDVALLDVSMPRMNGLELLRELRRAHSAMELPVIMVTATAASDTVVEALGHGANDYVTKPVDLPVLVARCTRSWSCAGCPGSRMNSSGSPATT